MVFSPLWATVSPLVPPYWSFSGARHLPTFQDGESLLAQRSMPRQEIDASNKENDLSNHLVASVGDEFSVKSVEATKGFDRNGACVMVNPRFVINHSNDDTNVKLTASFILYALFFVLVVMVATVKSHTTHQSRTTTTDVYLESIKPGSVTPVV
jgi:hypothetical protein